MKKFVVDAMLGKVALWLRLTGHDTIYSSELEDDELLSIATKENRVLLTSDAELNRRASDEKITTLLLRGNVDERIAKVFRQFNISPEIDPAKSRCSKCNGELVELRGEEKTRIRDLVFDQTYDYYNVFWLCEDCQTVFFEGSHWKNMREYMKRIQELINGS
jgi:uncharacterized protein with PIN domain